MALRTRYSYKAGVEHGPKPIWAGWQSSPTYFLKSIETILHAHFVFRKFKVEKFWLQGEKKRRDRRGGSQGVLENTLLTWEPCGKAWYPQPCAHQFPRMVPDHCISPRQGTGGPWSGEMEVLGKRLEMMILWDFLNSSNSKNTKSTYGKSSSVHIIITFLVIYSLIWMESAFEQFLLHISSNHGKIFHCSLLFLLVLSDFLLLFPTQLPLASAECWGLILPSAALLASQHSKLVTSQLISLLFW